MAGACVTVTLGWTNCAGYRVTFNRQSAVCSDRVFLVSVAVVIFVAFSIIGPRVKCDLQHTVSELYGSFTEPVLTSLGDLSCKGVAMFFRDILW